MLTMKSGVRVVLLLLVFLCASTSLNAQSGLLNSPNAHTFVFDCGAVGQFTTITPSRPTPALLDVSSGSVFLIASATSIFVDPSTGQTVFTITEPYGAGHGNASGIQGDLITCTSEPEAINVPPFGDVSATLVVTAFPTPRD